VAYKLKAALKTTLVPEIGPAPTSFTRNLAAYVQDFEGLLKLVPANCARFGGARFVQNILTSDSEALTTWPKLTTGVALPATVTGGFVDPDGGNNAFRVQTFLNGGTVGTDFSGIFSGNSTPIVGRKTTRQMWVKSNTGANQQFSLVQGAAYQAVATPVWQLHVVPVGGNDQNGFTFGSRGGLNGDVDILVYHPMLELVDGQSNQNPSDYVRSVGGAFPYAGAGAAGCAFFDYLNGNTVITDNSVAPANHYIVPARGAAIAAATLKRYRKEKLSTNYVVQSSAFNTWAQRNGHVVTPDATIAPDGTLTADLVTVTAVTITNQGVFTENVAAGNTQYAGSLWLKAGAGVTSVRLILKDRASDTVRGARSVPMTAGWAQCPAVNGVTAGATAGYRFEFQAEQNGTFFVWQGQVEPGFVGTSPIPTAGAAVTRPEDLLIWPLSVFSNAEGTCYATAEPDDWTQTNNARVIGGGTAGESGTALFTSNGRFGSYDNLSATQSVLVAGAAGKLPGAATWNAAASLKHAYINGLGGGGPPFTYDGSYNNSAIGIGMGGNIPFQGYIGDVVILDTALSEFDVPSLPDYKYPEIAPAIAGALSSPAVLVGALSSPAALVGALSTPAPITGAL
jgi:hypothetical protein